MLNHLGQIPVDFIGPIVHAEKHDEQIRFSVGVLAGDFEKGKVISGLDEASSVQTMAFHAGTMEREGSYYTNGGRVAAITSYGGTIQEAVSTSLTKIQSIHFDKMDFREDIGYEFLG